MARMTSWVHRYTLRELMDDTFDLFKERSVELLLAGLLPGCLTVIYIALMRTFYLTGNLLPHFDEESWTNLAGSGKFWLFILLLLLVVAPTSYFLGLIAQCRIALHHALGTDISIGKAFRFIAKPFFSLFVITPIYLFFLGIVVMIASFVVGLIIGLTTIITTAYALASTTAAVIVGTIGISIAVVVISLATIIASTFFLAAPISLAYEHTGPFRALSRSFSTASSNFKPHYMALYVVTHLPFVVLLLLALVGGLIYLPFQYTVPYCQDTIIVLLAMIFGAVFSGLLACLMSLIYLDGRCRSQAFDLQLLAADIGLGEEFERAFRPAAVIRTPQYPNYTAAPALPGAVSANTGFPDYSAGTVRPASQPAGAYPDYSAPPSTQPVAAPLNYSAPPLPGAGQVVPDYSAPPPALEPQTELAPAEAEPEPPVVATAPREGSDAS